MEPDPDASGKHRHRQSYGSGRGREVTNHPLSDQRPEHGPADDIRGEVPVGDDFSDPHRRGRTVDDDA